MIKLDPALLAVVSGIVSVVGVVRWRRVGRSRLVGLVVVVGLRGILRLRVAHGNAAGSPAGAVEGVAAHATTATSGYASADSLCERNERS